MCDTPILFSKLWYLSTGCLLSIVMKVLPGILSTWVAIESAHSSDALTYSIACNILVFQIVTNWFKETVMGMNDETPINGTLEWLHSFYIAYAKRTVFYVTSGFVWLIITKLWIFLGWWLACISVQFMILLSCGAVFFFNRNNVSNSQCLLCRHIYGHDWWHTQLSGCFLEGVVVIKHEFTWSYCIIYDCTCDWF